VDIELRHLRAFVAVADRSSFTQAADALAITQPQLSRTVRQLENALRVTLLDRSSRHVELTAVGRRFYDRTRTLLAELDRAVDAVRAQSTLRLGFSWLLPDPWAQHTFAAFESATGATVALVRCDDPMDALARATVDVVLVRGRTTSASAAPVQLVHLFDEARVAVCSTHSALAERPEIAWTDVPDWPLVVNTVSGTTTASSWPAGHGPTRIIETSNFDEWIETVAADRGIGVVPEVATRRGIHPAVRFVPLTGAPPSPVSLAFLPHVQEPLMRAFIDSAVRAGQPHGR
jgi:DNA-binding transcriptional LysR family regulator